MGEGRDERDVGRLATQAGRGPRGRGRDAAAHPSTRTSPPGLPRTQAPPLAPLTGQQGAHARTLGVQAHQREGQAVGEQRVEQLQVQAHLRASGEERVGIGSGVSQPGKASRTAGPECLNAARLGRAPCRRPRPACTTSKWAWAGTGASVPARSVRLAAAQWPGQTLPSLHGSVQLTRRVTASRPRLHSPKANRGATGGWPAAAAMGSEVASTTAKRCRNHRASRYLPWRGVGWGGLGGSRGARGRQPLANISTRARAEHTVPVAEPGAWETH